MCILIRRAGGGRGRARQAGGEQFSRLCATLSGELVEEEREQDRLEVSSFLDSMQPDQESWWRKRESKTG
jgi:hypothetical protein